MYERRQCCNSSVFDLAPTYVTVLDRQVEDSAPSVEL